MAAPFPSLVGALLATAPGFMTLLGSNGPPTAMPRCNYPPELTAFLMYARRGRSLYALIGPAEARAEMIWQFRDLCDLHHARPVFYQVRAQNLPFYMDIGLTALKLGEEAQVDLQRFDTMARSIAQRSSLLCWSSVLVLARIAHFLIRGAQNARQDRPLHRRVSRIQYRG